jgi:hypothetical protein
MAIWRATGDHAPGASIPSPTAIVATALVLIVSRTTVTVIASGIVIIGADRGVCPARTDAELGYRAKVVSGLGTRPSADGWFVSMLYQHHLLAPGRAPGVGSRSRAAGANARCWCISGPGHYLTGRA